MGACADAQSSSGAKLIKDLTTAHPHLPTSHTGVLTPHETPSPPPLQSTPKRRRTPPEPTSYPQPPKRARGFPQIADFLKEVVDVCADVQSSSGAKLIKDFTAALEKDSRIASIRGRVEAFSAGFPMPGFATDHLEH